MTTDSILGPTPPCDENAERAVLGQLLRLGHVPAEIAQLIGPSDFGRPALQQVAEICWDFTARKIEHDPVAVLSELRRRNAHRTVDGIYLHGLLAAAQPGIGWHARQVRDTSVRRQALAAMLRAAQQLAQPGIDPYDVAASAAVTAAGLAERNDPAASLPLTTLDAFLAGPDEYDWLIPGLLERGDRLLITGGEGSGKSWLSHQIAVCAAAGIHPFTGTRHKPIRVLRIDLENGTRHLRRSLRPLRQLAAKQHAPTELWIESRPSGIDLTHPDDEAWLRDLCATATPDLIVIGPLYRMHATDMAKEEPARQLTRVLDTLRARHGCALIVETHAPHAQGPGARDLRPVGSSLFRRWPEFGYGLRPQADNDMIVDFASWRGARDERDWPRQLTRGGIGNWPWVDYNPIKDNLHRYWEGMEEGA